MAENTEIGVDSQQDGIVSKNPYPAVFKPFADLLRKRFEGDVYTNEDCIRYCFFSILLDKIGISPNEIILEHPFFDKKEERKKVDFYVPATSDRDGMVVEFKYDRRLNIKQNKKKPWQAGQIIADINRLVRFEKGKLGIKQYLVYVTDDYMHEYLKGCNELKWLIELENDGEKKPILLSNEYFDDLNKSFKFGASGKKQKKGDSPGNIFEDNVVIPVILAYGEDISNNYVRVFEVNPRNKELHNSKYFPVIDDV